MKARRSFGYVGIQRHIGPAGFEDAQESDHQLKGALEANAHEDLRPHAILSEEARQLIGVRIEFPGRQLLVLKYDCNRLRSLRYLGLKQLMNTTRPVDTVSGWHSTLPAPDGALRPSTAAGP